MIWFKVLFGIIQLPIIFYLLVPFVTVVLVLIIEALHPNKTPVEIHKQYDFAAVVTAYQQAHFIPPLVDSLKKQIYKNIFIYVIADNIEEDLSYLNGPNVLIIQPKEPLKAKTKSIALAIQSFVREHDVISVFDADNLVHPNYFVVMNEYFNKGFRAVQGRIKAKNLNTTAACMDAANETYYTFIDKYSRPILGLSSGFWGLGFAMDLKAFKQINFDHFLSGFDKKLQSTAILIVKRIGYASDAIVYDEKTMSTTGLMSQRAKWLSGYFHYYQLGINIIKRGLIHFNVDKVYYGINHMRPPLVLLAPASVLFLCIDFFVSFDLFVLMITSILLFGLGFILIVKNFAYSPKIVQVLPAIPQFVFYQVLALFRSKEGKKHFHTDHNFLVNIEDMQAYYHE